MSDVGKVVVSAGAYLGVVLAVGMLAQLRSAEKSGRQRFVKLRNEGKNQSDTEGKV